MSEKKLSRGKKTSKSIFVFTNHERWPLIYVSLSMVIMTSKNPSTRGRTGPWGQIFDNAGICENIKPNCHSPFKFTSFQQNLIIKKALLFRIHVCCCHNWQQGLTERWPLFFKRRLAVLNYWKRFWNLQIKQLIFSFEQSSLVSLVAMHISL